MEQSFFASFWMAATKKYARIRKNQSRSRIIFWLHTAWSAFLVVNCIFFIFLYQYYFWPFVLVVLIGILVPRFYGEYPISIWQRHCEGNVCGDKKESSLSFLQSIFMKVFGAKVSSKSIKIGHFAAYALTMVIGVFRNGLPPIPFL